MNISNCAKDPTLDYEFELLAKAPLVIGLDEVGRGAIAGPVAVGAQVFTPDAGEIPAGLRDSKLLTEKRREAVAPLLDAWGAGAVAFGAAAEIDANGITEMLGRTAREALSMLHEVGIPVQHAVILLDGKHDWLSPQLNSPLTVVTRVGADRACATVAAASVRAKVQRDHFMIAAAKNFPHYAWERNKGYGSKAHFAGIATHGVTELHRKTWIRLP
ncbi:ribonuclease HII [Canibacter zhoujuaniae]|uniref:ribonuclease HII n=1 Tax=Canibacter zhoujuaniae TaxID=2708343 RepID=UPI0014219770|nr:ribonuclease HII [Canibacter zhoujuaniae]